MLRQRIYTAIVMVISVLAIMLYAPLIIFDATISLLMSLAAFEFALLFWPRNLVKLGSFVVSLMLLLWLFKVTATTLPVLIIGVAWWLVVPYFIWHFISTGKHYLQEDLWRWIAGVLTFIPFAIGCVVLRQVFGVGYLLYVLVIVCAADIGAYFVGMKWGKTRLAKKVSPKKSIEGLIGGLGLSLTVAVIGGYVLHLQGIKWLLVLTLVVIVVLWSVVGDLFESMLKRQAGVKDSGQLLPGHGGVYDRIDSLVAAIPIFTLGMLLIGR